MIDDFIRLDGDGVSVLLDMRGVGLPRVLHWGGSLGQLTPVDAAEIASALSRQTPPATLDAAWDVSLFPTEGDGWSGRPGVQLRQGGVQLRTRFTTRSVSRASSSPASLA